MPTQTVNLTLQQDITRVALQALISGSTVIPKRTYRITDAIGPTAEIILVKGLTINTITGYAINETTNEWGIYNITDDTFTLQVGTLQQVIDSGATLDKLNSINGSGFNFTWDNFLRFIVNTTQRIALISASGSDSANFQISPTDVIAVVGDGVNNSSVSQTSTVFKIENCALDEHQAADVASAATTNLAQLIGNSVTITGTTTITAFGSVDAGARRMVTFAGILTLTHNATSLILPTGANITTAAGDTCIAISLGSGNWRVFDYQRASGNPLNYEENIDWISGSAVTGYSALTVNECYYTRVGKLVTVTYNFLGTSNATTITFTLPYAAYADQFYLTSLVTNNGTASVNPGRLSLTAGSTTVTATRDRVATAWTNSGQKYITGVFTYLMQ